MKRTTRKSRNIVAVNEIIDPVTVSTDIAQMNAVTVEPDAVDPVDVNYDPVDPVDAVDTVDDDMTVDAVDPVDPVDPAIDPDKVDAVDPDKSTDTDAVDPVEPDKVLTPFEVKLNLYKSIAHLITSTHWSIARGRVNGIGTPSGDGKCAYAWYWFDFCFMTGIRDRATIFDLGSTVHGLSRGNMSTELSNYCTRHGIVRERSRKVTVAPVTMSTPSTPSTPSGDLIAPDAITTVIKNVDA